MSWLLQLYKTYQVNEQAVGIIEKKYEDREYTLLPVAHTTQNAHIEVVIDEDGDFLYAQVLNKANTLIPATDDSASRSGSKVAPYPLHDKLAYVAGDFEKYGGNVKKSKITPYQTYISNLEEWVNSPYGNERVRLIYEYLKKGTLIEDLVNNSKLITDKNDNLIEKWKAEYEKELGEKPDIFSSGTTDQFSVFVRFTTYSPDGIPVWRDKEVYKSFSDFYESQIKESKELDTCFVTGEQAITTERHTNKIRHAADKAKLISSNDTSGFTYRGKFKNSQEVAAISYEVSQKAHNALKWLIHRQGKSIDNRVFLVWGIAGDNQSTSGSAELDAPDPMGDPIDILFSETIEAKKFTPDTDKPFAKELNKAIDGYKHNLTSDSNINVLTLDSATTGRLAVLYYRHLNTELYLQRIKDWHTDCAWEHRYRKLNEKFVSFYGAPATRDIAFAVYGSRANEKVVKGLMERILPCIIDKQNIPRDILRSAVQRSSNPVSMEKWEWEKTLSITCALARKSLLEKKEEWNVALNKECDDRNYLFGRLLAVADVLERSVLDDKEENRATNAIRYMNSFSKQPARTWLTLQSNLQPYQARLWTRSPKRAAFFTKLIDDIADKFKDGDFSDIPLTQEYLLGLYSQRKSLYTKKEKEGAGKDDSIKQEN
ncbi:type I-C CRISPR-associated protein Cas8c/Csd1 [Oceanobacillus sp. CFH 90083]|uniref:type I-C CRISPR-associated protein Cas8c/Csd1 n=1 Tax=Oceanobacillus sp. CFH 90083 TaxID=2592336 RepID=UPI00128E15A4|nr:type I-C CRISPR-associated protein Cas8c/Csd1 [Oceanobacillus sp. CFH 90083]